MVYTPQTWHNEPATDTPLSASRAAYIEAGLVAASKGTVGLNNQTGTSYTLQASDIGNLVTCSSTGAIQVTVPANVFAVGERADIIVLNTGMVTVVAGSGTNVYGTPSLVSRARYSGMSVVCIATNTFVLVGDLA
jgi:hypothetical protein